VSAPAPPSVDGVSLRPRIRLEPDAFDIASDHARTRGTTITEAVNEMLRSFAPPVEQGSRPPAPEDGREGSGEPPASLPSVLYPCKTIFCTEGRGCTKDPLWSFTDQNVLPWIGEACCDDHIPDGWVKPVSLEESKALHPSSRPVVEYVKACVFCGERSSHGRCS